MMTDSASLTPGFPYKDPGPASTMALLVCALVGAMCGERQAFGESNGNASAAVPRPEMLAELRATWALAQRHSALRSGRAAPPATGQSAVPGHLQSARFCVPLPSRAGWPGGAGRG